jgi:hypothetical protein
VCCQLTRLEVKEVKAEITKKSRSEESKVTLTKAVLCKHRLAVLYPGARVRLARARQ